MQIVQKIYIECQEMMPDMKIKTGHFWFQNKKYEIINGEIKEQPKDETIPF